MTASHPDDPSRGGWSEPGFAVAPLGEELDPPSSEARYTRGPLLGRGGMGAVYVARDAALGRDVALKELPGDVPDGALARVQLQREAMITSRLDHPGIVTVHDAATRGAGRPWYTMRLVRGATLARAIADARTPTERRALLRSVLAAAEAVGAAHDAGIVHRDIKPANVLIGRHRETQVADWGLATPTPEAAARWSDLPPLPAAGPAGTPAFMCPEQACGEPPDPRHDVWALGRTLAEVLGPTAHPPELTAIVARATAPAPSDRYPDASAFADDLLRWFEGRQVVAHTYTPTELLARTARAYRLPLAVAGVGLVALSATVAVGWWQTARSLDRALAAERVAADALADLRLEQAVAATRDGARERAEALARAVLAHRPDPVATGVIAAFARAGRLSPASEGLAPPCAWASLAVDGSWLLCGRVDGAERYDLAAERGGARVLAAPAWRTETLARAGAVVGDRALLTDAAGATVALDGATGAPVGRFALSGAVWSAQEPPRLLWAGSAPLEPPSPPPDRCAGSIRVNAADAGRFVAVCEDGTLLIGSGASVIEAATQVTGEHVATAVALFGDRVLVGTLRGRLHAFDAATGVELDAIPVGAHAIQTIRVSPDGRHAAVGGAGPTASLLRLAPLAVIDRVDVGRPGALALTDAHLHIVDDRVRTFALPEGPPAVIDARVGLGEVAVRPDGGGIALAGGGGVVLTVDLRTGDVARLALGDRVVKAVAFGPGGLVATGMGAPYVGRVGPARPAEPFPGAQPLRRIVATADGVVVGSDLHAGLLRWDPQGAVARLAPDRLFVDLEPDGTTIVTLDAAGAVDRLDGDSLTPLASAPGARAVASRGERLAWAIADAVVVRDAAGDRRLTAPGASLLDLALSADGARVAAGAVDGRAFVWDADTSALIAVLPGHTERVSALEFLPDGDLVTVSWDHTARLWGLREVR